jgi:ATP-binding cassette subfamily B multidrug efflux pump
MIKKLAGCIGEYKKESILAPLFVILEVVLEVLIPTYMANLIDYGITGGNMNQILKFGITLAIFALLALVFGLLCAVYASKASVGFAKNLRKKVFYKVQDYSFANIDKFSAASLVTRLTTDLTNVQMAYMMIIRVAIRCPLMMIFALVMTFTINTKLALVYLIMIPIIGFGLGLVIHFVHPIFQKVFKTYDKLNSVVQENLRGIRVVKSFVREEHEKEKFGRVSQTIFKDFSKAEKIIAFNGPIMQFAIYGGSILVYWLAAKQIVGGTMTTGQLSGIVTYSTQILFNLLMLSMIFVMVSMARTSAQRIIEVLDEKSDIVDRENPVYEVKDGSVVFKDVSFSYSKDPEKLCLKHINLTIKSGETVGIIGGTGSSKSSLIQLIPRLYDVTMGQVLVGGVDVRDYDLETLRQNVAMVLQKNVLFSGTIKENLRWGDPKATDEEIERVCRLACADEFIETMPDRYDTYIEQGGSNVSGGQRQRLCIARALLKKPKILILDDSTSAVDTKTDARIRQAFRDEIPHTTKFIIAQRISSVEDADKIIVLDNGEVNGFGTHEELLQTNEIYKEVYYSQMKGSDTSEHA